MSAYYPKAVREVNCDELIEFIRENGENPIRFDIYNDYDEETGDCSGIYRAEIMEFADSTIFLLGYYGGGSLFAWDIDDWLNNREDGEDFKEALKLYVGMWFGGQLYISLCKEEKCSFYDTHFCACKYEELTGKEPKVASDGECLACSS